MNIVDIIERKIESNPVEFYNLENKGIKIIHKSDILYFRRTLPESVKAYVTGHKLVSFFNECETFKECICLYHKSILNNNVVFVKESNNEFKIEPAATFFSETISDETKEILDLLNIEIIEDKISYYDNYSIVITKLIVNI